MSSAKPALRPVDFAAAARIVEEHSKEQGIPTLVKTGRAPAAMAETPAATAAAPEPAKSPDAPAKKGKAVKSAEAQTLSPVKRMAVDLPLYLISEIRKRAADDDTTIRYIITRALKKDNFKVEPQDLIEDGRREH